MDARPLLYPLYAQQTGFCCAAITFNFTSPVLINLSNAGNTTEQIELLQLPSLRHFLLKHKAS